MAVFEDEKSLRFWKCLEQLQAFFKTQHQDGSRKSVGIEASGCRHRYTGQLLWRLAGGRVKDMVSDIVVTEPCGIVNTYDHLLLQATFTTEYTGTRGTKAFDEDPQVFDGDDELASAACSDHRPVWAEFRVPNADDD